MSKDNKTNSEVISFADVLKKKTDQMKTDKILLDGIKVEKEAHEVDEIDEDRLLEGVQAFHDGLENATGFIAISFNEDGNPHVVHAGDLDLLKTIGTLEFVKTEIQGSAYSIDDIFNQDDI